jgi:hypothetical protein
VTNPPHPTPPTLREQAFGLKPCYIPYLPEGLRWVPDPPATRADPRAAAKRAAFDEWRAGVLAHRAEVHARLARPGGGDLKRAVRDACAADEAYFVAMFCRVYEPRRSARGGAGLIPFVPFSVQVRLLRRLRWMLDEAPPDSPEGDLIIDKSRDMGATWIVAMFLTWGFLFEQPFTAKTVSRSESEVEKTHQPDAILTRVMENLKGIKHGFVEGDGSRSPAADYLLPFGYEPETHHRELLFFRPDGLNTIHGESTKAGTTGRGGRSTFAVVDEAGAITGIEEIAATLVNTADHRVILGTQSLSFGYGWYRMTHPDEVGGDEDDEAGPPVLAMEWWQHPWHDQDWYDGQRRRMKDDARFFREVERDVFHGDTTLVYPEAFDLKTEWCPYPEKSGNPVYVTMDPGLDDETAIHVLWKNAGVEPINNVPPGEYALVDTYTNAGKPPEYYGALLLGVNDPDYHLGSREHEFQRLLASLPIPSFYFGDPAGKAKTHKDDHKETWYGKIAEYTIGRGYELRVQSWRERNPAEAASGSVPKKRIIAFVSKTKDDARYISGRRRSLKLLFKVLHFHRTNEVSRTLTALRELKFEEHTGARPPQRERDSYAHTWRAHRAASLEYGAVNLEDYDAILRQRKQREERKKAARSDVWSTPTRNPVRINSRR